ncbi:MAG: ATP-binding protein [Desulfobacteraceae bacterium]|jgi:two-component system cell cycle sensor histidine kinase/response regulator CckA|nr:ATP-binding protein [Desulfobacteraceae bacterium]
MKEDTTDPSGDLRRRAEKIDRETSLLENIDNLSPAEIKQMLHELRVHQIELKMQNEELRTTQEDLAASRERYVDLYDFAPVGYITLSEEGIIRESNLTAAGLLGLTRKALIRQPLSRFIIAEDQNSYYLHRKKLFESGEPQACELRLVTSAGESFWALLSATIAERNGAPVCRMVMSDVSERKKLEAQLQQAQKMESIGTLAGGIAHDFNNILSSIIGFTELSLDDVEQGSPLEENLQEVFTAGIRAKDLIGQILILSRQDAFEFMPIPINPVAKEAVKMLRSAIPASINIQGNICDKQLVVQANPTQIHQVLINLATNANHAMSETGGVLMVDVDYVSFDEISENINLTPGDYARITVSDTGTGINKDHLEKIFEPYFTTKAVGKGSGLGLSVVHGIVRSHKGDITVSSAPGKGTTFHVYLPLSEQQSIELPDTSEEPLPRGTEHILLVDDEPTIVKMLQRSLDRIGYTVTARPGSVEALETFCATPEKFDLIITDMAMPDMTGDKLADEIKKIRHDVPVILCTGFSDTIKIRTGPEMQIDEFLTKPVDRNKLLKVIRKLLDKTES